MDMYEFELIEIICVNENDYYYVKQVIFVMDVYYQCYQKVFSVNFVFQLIYLLIVWVVYIFVWYFDEL